MTTEKHPHQYIFDHTLNSEQEAYCTMTASYYCSTSLITGCFGEWAFAPMLATCYDTLASQVQVTQHRGDGYTYAKGERACLTTP